MGLGETVTTKQTKSLSVGPGNLSPHAWQELLKCLFCCLGSAPRMNQAQVQFHVTPTDTNMCHLIKVQAGPWGVGIGKLKGNLKLR